MDIHCTVMLDPISGVMVSVLTSSVVDREFLEL